jgi:hypothetical protein
MPKYRNHAGGIVTEYVLFDISEAAGRQRQEWVVTRQWPTVPSATHSTRLKAEIAGIDMAAN